MAIINIPFTFSAGAVIIASQHNSNFSIIYSDYNGNIDNSNISASAAIAYSKLNLALSIVNADISTSAGIVDTKLATISTAGKVSGAALTSLSSTPSGAGVMPAANVFPAGMIVLWSGTIATIPSGWVLCNGSNSTPDLRNLFVVCADADAGGVAKSTITGAALQSGGSVTISTNNLPAHTHNANVYTSDTGSGATAAQASTNVAVGDLVATSSTGSGTAYTQPFYALAYIMKT